MNRLLPPEAGAVHLMGLAGVGMAGLAALLSDAGYLVQGSDLRQNQLTDWLSAKGVKLFKGHDATHIGPHVAWAVRSTAIPKQNPEWLELQKRQLPVIQRGRVLGTLLSALPDSVAVSGTHGKTTTSAMLTAMLRRVHPETGFFVGWESCAYDGVAALGDASMLVAEADESDGTVQYYHPGRSIITNIEFDHMEHFDAPEAMEACLLKVMQQSRHGVIYCSDDPVARKLAQSMGVSYGFGSAADYRLSHLRQQPHSLCFTLSHRGKVLGELPLPCSGRHNALNAAGAASCALEMGLPFADIAAALATFRPVQRRFETVFDNNDIRIISDYAHHPSEIAAVMEQARNLHAHRILAIFQPHRYTRTKMLGKNFVPAFEGIDQLWIPPVYAASEQPVQGGRSSDLVQHFNRPSVSACASLTDAWIAAREALRPGDLLLLIGAGDIDALRTQLPSLETPSISSSRI